MRYVQFLIFSILLSSCLTYKDVNVIGIEDVKIKNFTQKGIEAEIAIKINNPNNYSISIVATDLDILVNKKAMGKAKVKDKIILKKQTEDVYKFTISADYKDTAGGGLLSLFSLVTSKSIDLGIKGTIKAKTILVTKRIDIDFNEKVEL